MGRTFETVAFLSLARTRRPDDVALRERIAGLERSLVEPNSPRAGGRLADLLQLAPESISTESTPRVNSETAANPSVSFVEQAERFGLTFAFENGRSPARQLPETMSGGVGLIDYDGDVYLDVYCVQGERFPPDPAEPPPGDRLFRNKGDGTFEDVTDRTGIARMTKGYGHGVTVGDIDNDGRPDLFVTRWRHYALYQNRGDGTYEDATDRWGLSGDRDWPTLAAFADLDNDGDLDLYVCHYVEWDAANPRLCRNSRTGRFISCNPKTCRARPDHLFRNDCGRFVDVSEEAGIWSADREGRGLGVVAVDRDADGLVDLFVANDKSANFLFHNLGGFRFEEVAHDAGVAGNADGGYQAGMGVACCDLDGDGRPDLIVTNYYGESTSFFRNHGGLVFTDRTASSGIGAASRLRLGSGACLIDGDNDGRFDVLTADGHTDDMGDVPFRMRTQLLRGDGRGRFTDVTEAAGPAFLVARLGRGLAVGDLDNDGKTDALLVALNEPLAYFHNRTPGGGHWLRLELEGVRSNHDGVGAVVSVVAGGRRSVAWRVGGGSYQSAGDPPGPISASGPRNGPRWSR